MADHPALHIEARPSSSPCATCATPIDPGLNTVAFANDARGTVCDRCAMQSDPAAAVTLVELRTLDATYWQIHDRKGHDGPAGRADADKWLATILAGVTALVDMYGAGRLSRPLAGTEATATALKEA